MKIEGADFMCGLTFPVGDSHASLILGGWGGTVAGISSIDGHDASENETSSFISFPKDRWYTIRMRVTPNKAVGLHATWFVYRGSGKVTFDPEQISVWEDTRPGANSPWAPIWIAPQMPDGGSVAQVTFSEPGTYVIRVRADDGGLTSDDEIAVTVTK